MDGRKREKKREREGERKEGRDFYVYLVLYKQK